MSDGSVKLHFLIETILNYCHKFEHFQITARIWIISQIKKKKKVSFFQMNLVGKNLKSDYL